MQQHDSRTIALASFSVSDIQEAGIDLFQRAEGRARPVPHHTCHLSSKTISPEMCYTTKDEVTQESLELHTIPQTLHSAWTRLGRIQHLLSVAGVPGEVSRQRVDMLLPCYFALLAWCCRVTWKEKSTPMPRHSYRERGYAFGQAMLTLPVQLPLTPSRRLPRLIWSPQPP